MNDLLDLHAPTLAVEEVTLIEYATILAKARFQVAEFRPRDLMIDRPPKERANREGGGAVPFHAGALEKIAHLAPAGFRADYIHEARPQEFDRRALNGDEHDQHCEDDETHLVSEPDTIGLNENFGAPYAVEVGPFTSPLGMPCNAPPWGYVAGADLRTGEVAWQHKNGTVRDRAPLPLNMGVPNLGDPLVTAGGVAFLSGTIDYFVRAYDRTSGATLWQSHQPAGGQATPMNYLGDDGAQYVVVVAGGHGSLGTKAGDAIIAYRLPR